jgi:hypothetical protein
MMMTMMAHANSSSTPSPHRIVKWIVLVSSTMSCVLLVSLTISELSSLETRTSTTASLHAAATLHQSTAEIAMSGSSLSTTSATLSSTMKTTTTPSWSSTMMNWSSLLGQDEKNKKSAADDSQLVPQQGQARPTHEGKKKGEEKEQLSTLGDVVVHDVVETAAVGPVPGENLKGDELVRQQYQYQQPLLADLIDEEAMEIKMNVSVQFLMDFAIIGHPKCGTTFLLRKWLGQHVEIVMPARETRVLSGSTGAMQMVQALYPLQQLPVVPVPVPLPSAASGSTSASGSNGGPHHPPPMNVKRGYKNPAHILHPWALQHFETYWPESKLIIGVRHPVLWFESFYNYRLKRDVLPPPDSLVGACTNQTHDVCTDSANFHVHLATLGKTNLTEQERTLFDTQTTMSTSTFDHHHHPTVPRSPKNQLHLPNPVFLYDVSQLAGSNVDISETVRRDMQDYLGLQQPLPVLEPASKHVASTMDMDICLPEHDVLRTQLLQIAWQASEWITTYFLPLPDVTVPAPEHFRSVLLNDWRRDPCETRRN